MPRTDTAPLTTLADLVPNQRVRVILDDTGYWADDEPIVQACTVVSIDEDGDADLRVDATNDDPADIGSVWTLYAKQVGAPADEGGVRVEVAA